jgi:hypothetical protein
VDDLQTVLALKDFPLLLGWSVEGDQQRHQDGDDAEDDQEFGEGESADGTWRHGAWDTGQTGSPSNLSLPDFECVPILIAIRYSLSFSVAVDSRSNKPVANRQSLFAAALFALHRSSRS